MPEPSFAGIGWSIYLFGYAVCDLASHPCDELVAFAQRTKITDPFPFPRGLHRQGRGGVSNISHTQLNNRHRLNSFRCPNRAMTGRARRYVHPSWPVRCHSFYFLARNPNCLALDNKTCMHLFG
jgi:hypothetical protein